MILAGKDMSWLTFIRNYDSKKLHDALFGFFIISIDIYDTVLIIVFPKLTIFPNERLRKASRQNLETFQKNIPKT